MATLELLAQDGWSGFAIDSLARRAGVSRAAVYGRFRTREDAAVAALVASVPALEDDPSRDPFQRLLALVAGLIVPLSHAPWGRAVLAVHAVADPGSALSRAMIDGYWRPRRAPFTACFAALRDAQLLPSSMTAERARDLVFGPLVYRWLITGQAITPDEVAEHLRGLGIGRT